MTDFTATVPLGHQGKHNMASEAFEALRTARTGAGAKQADGASGANGLSFGDLVDTLNPLQHIPVVSSLYRELTGDTISPQARVAGGALYGGPIGLVASVFDAAVEAVSGADMGEHMIASLTGGTTTEPTALVEANPKPGAPTRSQPSQPAQTAAADKPDAAPIQLAQADQTDRTASLAGPTPAVPPQSVPKSLPQLSPDAFNALLSSFADPKAAKDANPALAAAADAGAANKATAAPTKPAVADLAGAMAQGLDQLDALKRVHPDIPLATSFAEPATGGL